MLKTSLVLIALVAVVALPAQADPVSPPCGFDFLAEETVVSPTALDLEPLFVANSSAGSMRRDAGPGGFAAACEWYDITCSDGRTEECCGSESSCLAYCEEFCGEPCRVAGGPQPV